MAWLYDYSHRIKIISDSSKVDSDLTDFPLGVTLSSGCGINSFDASYIFDEVGEDYSKIVITANDGITILPVEVEYWNSFSKEAQLWFKAPNVYSAVDTDFYLYYDATASGNNSIGKNTDIDTSQSVDLVWNSSYKAVYHMNNNPSGGADCIKDSTSNKNHGTPGGSISSDCLISNNGIKLDGIDDSITYINSTVKNNFIIFARVSVTNTHQIDSESTSGTAGTVGQRYLLMPPNGGSSDIGIGVSMGTNGVSVYEHGDYHMPAISVYSGSIGTDINNIIIFYADSIAKIYLNGILVRTGLTSTKSNAFAPYIIGYSIYPPIDGILYDWFICDIKSEDWIKVNDCSFSDTLLFFEEEQPPYVFEGLVSYGDSTLSGIPVRLYRRSNGKLIDSSFTTSSGTFSLCSPYNTEDHYVVALYNHFSKNAIIADWLNQNNE